MNRRTTTLCWGLLLLLPVFLVSARLPSKNHLIPSSWCAAGGGGAATAVVVATSHQRRPSCSRSEPTSSSSPASFSAATRLCRTLPRGGSSANEGEEEVAQAPTVADTDEGDTAMHSRHHPNHDDDGGGDGEHSTTTTFVHPAGAIVLEERRVSPEYSDDDNAALLREEAPAVSHDEAEPPPHMIEAVVVVPTEEERPDAGLVAPPDVERGANHPLDGPPTDADPPAAAIAGEAPLDVTPPILVQDRRAEPPTHTAPSAPLPQVETIDLPADAPFLHSTASSPTSQTTTTTAFVKRAPKRHPKTIVVGGRVIRPQSSQRHDDPQEEPGHDHDGETSSQAAAPATIPDPAPLSSASKTPVLRTLLTPATLLASAISAILRNPFCLYYLCALVGTSIGFTQFLYLSTIGYAWGVALPVAAAMFRCRRVTHLPSVLVLLWAVRLSVFLLWREYFNWPALHAHMQWVPSPPLPTQILGWVLYSALYWAVASPCWWTLLNAPPSSPHRSTAHGTTTAAPSSSPTDRPPTLSHPLGVALQIAGLALETVADWQKSHFKASHRREWCHVGVWKYCTHPNYLGEGLFWAGTHLSGLHALLMNDRHPRTRTAASRAGQLVASGIGLSFVATVLRGAVLHLRDAHALKYGSDPLFQTYRDQYGLLGYKVWDAYVRRRALRAAGAAMPLSIDAPEDGTAPVEESPAAAQET